MRKFESAKELAVNTMSSSKVCPPLDSSILRVNELNLMGNQPSSWLKLFSKKTVKFDNWELLREEIYGRIAFKLSSVVGDVEAFELRRKVSKSLDDFWTIFAKYKLSRLEGDSCQDAKILLTFYILNPRDDDEMYILPRLMENAYQNRLFPCAWAGKYPKGKMLAFELPEVK